MMKIKWSSIKTDEIDFLCPKCGSNVAPPEYPYCKHVLFVHVDPSSDDSQFDYMREDFADKWRKKEELESNGEEPIEINIQNLQSIELRLICEVIEIKESSGYYPVSITVGLVD